MFWRIKGFSDQLRSQPKPSASVVGSIVHTHRIVKVKDVQGGDGALWSEVVARDNIGGDVKGFIPADRIAQDAFDDLQRPRPEIVDRTRFIGVLSIAAVRFGTSRDYLACVAQIESGMTNPPPQTPGGVEGPFQFLKSTWDGLVSQDMASADPVGVMEDEIDEPVAQAFMAARFAAGNTEALAKDQALGRIPTGAELYAAHFFGLPAATALMKAREADGATPVDQALRDFYAGTDRGAGFADTVMARNPGVLSENGAPLSLDGVIERIEEKFDRAAADLAPDYAALPPDLRRAGAAPGGAPPWLPTAQGELGVAENGGDANRDRIRGYHASTGVVDEPETPWCASFVCWSLANCGDAKTAKNRLKSKRAADWKAWGRAADDPPPLGALVLTNPLVEGTSGHVGFLLEYDPQNGRVKIVGGNQGKPGDVSEKTFKASQIAAYRWFDYG